MTGEGSSITWAVCAQVGKPFFTHADRQDSVRVGWHTGILAGFVDGRLHRKLLGMGSGSVMAIMLLPGFSSSPLHSAIICAISSSRCVAEDCVRGCLQLSLPPRTHRSVPPFVMARFASVVSWPVTPNASVDTDERPEVEAGDRNFEFQLVPFHSSLMLLIWIALECDLRS